MARVLFVDDDPFTLQTLTRAVELLGHQALIANTGQEGITLAAQELPDLIFSDLRLSDMDGLRLVREIKRSPLSGHIPVLILSAIPEMDASSLAMAAGADAYLDKPVRLQALLEVIERYTGGASTADPQSPTGVS
jgi:twitching motility two-component system response regulator PilH